MIEFKNPFGPGSTSGYLHAIIGTVVLATIEPLGRHRIDTQCRHAHKVTVFYNAVWHTHYANNVDEAKAKVISQLVAHHLEQS